MEYNRIVQGLSAQSGHLLRAIQMLEHVTEGTVQMPLQYWRGINHPAGKPVPSLVTLRVRKFFLMPRSSFALFKRLCAHIQKECQ